MRCIRGGGSADTEAVEIKPVVGDILLGLKHDYVDLRSEHAAQDHEAAQADRDTHGSGLNLQRKEDRHQLGATLREKILKVAQYLLLLDHFLIII